VLAIADYRSIYSDNHITLGIDGHSKKENCLQWWPSLDLIRLQCLPLLSVEAVISIISSRNMISASRRLIVSSFPWVVVIVVTDPFAVYAVAKCVVEAVISIISNKERGFSAVIAGRARGTESYEWGLQSSDILRKRQTTRQWLPKVNAIDSHR